MALEDTAGLEDTAAPGDLATAAPEDPAPRRASAEGAVRAGTELDRLGARLHRAARAGLPQHAQLALSRDGSLADFAVTHGGPATLSPTVRALLRAQLPDAQVIGLTTCMTPDGGALTVQARTRAGRRCALHTRAAGTMEFLSCSLAPHEIAPPARAALLALLPGAELLAAELQVRPAGDRLVLHARRQGEAHRVTLATDYGVVEHVTQLAATLWLEAEATPP